MKTKLLIIFTLIFLIAIPSLITAKLGPNGTDEGQLLIGETKWCFHNGMYMTIVVNTPDGFLQYRPHIMPLSYYIQGLKLAFRGHAIDDPWPDRTGIYIELDELYRYYEGEGRLTYVPLDEGFWGIISDEGYLFDICIYDLPIEYQKEGLGCRYSGYVLDGVSYHQWGLLFSIMDFEPIFTIEEFRG